MNFEHRTSNIERRTGAALGRALLRRLMFDVQCSMFAFVLFAGARAFGQVPDAPSAVPPPPAAPAKSQLEVGEKGILRAQDVKKA